MTDDAEWALDSAEAWHERLGWVFGLIAEDRDERLAALRQQIAACRRAGETRLRSNHLWHVTRPLGPVEQYREPGYALAREVDFAVRTRMLDRKYVRVARAIDNAELRERLAG
ncbi:hypothetical protein [Streptacidiphilus anmyonensis]|uniref:hypothetical protein n=1 Tax=Streptacidiphilus anmyonensis TaxID=405782 RepID=UPI0005A6D1AE|nr:hypothetical protein [Streptacidiphilus anmyonensis]